MVCSVVRFINLIFFESGLLLYKAACTQLVFSLLASALFHSLALSPEILRYEKQYSLKCPVSTLIAAFVGTPFGNVTEQNPKAKTKRSDHIAYKYKPESLYSNVTL